jgi:hypothetical protein
VLSRYRHARQEPRRGMMVFRAVTPDIRRGNTILLAIT